MKEAYCPNCQKKMGFRRALGFGTFFAVLLTFGWWILMIPFYHLRCIGCGCEIPSRAKEGKQEGKYRKGASPGIMGKMSTPKKANEQGVKDNLKAIVFPIFNSKPLIFMVAGIYIMIFLKVLTEIINHYF